MAEHSWFYPKYVRNMYASKRCFDPQKDILMPVFTSIKQLLTSPHLDEGRAPKRGPRGRLFHWRGQVLRQFPKYSMGIRQQVFELFKGREREGITVSDKHSPHYLDEVAQSTFCGVFPGNGWGHIETPILLGCIPVVVQDGILTPWETVLDFASFAVRLPRASLPELPEILRAIPEERIVRMQDALAKVWERFTYSSLALAERARRCGGDGTRVPASPACLANAQERHFGAGAGEGLLSGRITGRDAVDTLMQVLHARLLAREPAAARDAASEAARGRGAQGGAEQEGPRARPARARRGRGRRRSG